MDDTPGGCQVTFTGKPEHFIPRDWKLSYDLYSSLRLAGVQNLYVYHHAEELTDKEIEYHLDIARHFGVPLEPVTVNDNRGVKYTKAGQHCFAIVVDRKHVVVGGANGYGARDFVNSFKASEDAK